MQTGEQQKTRTCIPQRMVCRLCNSEHNFFFCASSYGWRKTIRKNGFRTKLWDLHKYIYSIVLPRGELKYSGRMEYLMSKNCKLLASCFVWMNCKGNVWFIHEKWESIGAVKSLCNNFNIVSLYVLHWK